MDTDQTTEAIEPVYVFKRGDLVSLTKEAKKILTFLKKDVYAVKKHSKDSSVRAEIVTIEDDDKDDRDIHVDFLELVRSS